MRMSKIYRLTISSVGKGVEELEHSYTAGGNFQPLLKTIWQVFKKLNIHLCDLAIPLPYSPTRNESIYMFSTKSYT